MNFEFKHNDDGEFGNPESVSVQFDAETWMDIADKFVNFLQGCGYMVGKEKLGDYYLADIEIQGELEI